MDANNDGPATAGAAGAGAPGAGPPAPTWALTQGNVLDHYEFGEVLEESRTVVIAAGIPLRQTLCECRPLGYSTTLPLMAKTYILRNNTELNALKRHLQAWAGVDAIDRPGSGKLIAAYEAREEVTVALKNTTTAAPPPSSSPPTAGEGAAATPAPTTTAATRFLPRVTVIQEGSPIPASPLQQGFDSAYHYFPDRLIGRGGNAGGIGQRNNNFGGVYEGKAIDFGKPLPPLAVKRVDGRDNRPPLLVGRTRIIERPNSINLALGVKKMETEVVTWQSVHYPTPHPRVVRIFDAFLDAVPGVPDCNVASIVLECAPAARFIVRKDSPAAGSPGAMAGPTPDTVSIPRPTDLVDYVVKTGTNISPFQGAHVMAQLLMALFHLHNRYPQLVHRDIKGDNILLWHIEEKVTLFKSPSSAFSSASATASSEEASSTSITAAGGGGEMVVKESTDLFLIKLADFGEARFVLADEAAMTNVGTDAYKAPEVGQLGQGQGQSPAVDVYSCGVTLFTLLIAAAPHGTEPDLSRISKHEWFERLRGGAARLNESRAFDKFLALPGSAQDLIMKMMEVDPEKRITIPEIFEHAFFRENAGIYYKVGDKKVPLVPTWRPSGGA